MQAATNDGPMKAFQYKTSIPRDFPGSCSIAGQGSKILQAEWCGQTTTNTVIPKVFTAQSVPLPPIPQSSHGITPVCVSVSKFPAFIRASVR